MTRNASESACSHAVCWLRNFFSLYPAAPDGDVPSRGSVRALQRFLAFAEGKQDDAAAFATKLLDALPGELRGYFMIHASTTSTCSSCSTSWGGRHEEGYSTAWSLQPLQASRWRLHPLQISLESFMVT